MLHAIRAGERVLITGGTGSLGTRLVEVLSNRLDVSVRVFSRDEKKQYDLRRRFPQVEYQLGDVRDPAAVSDAVRDVDVVVHCASLKYVDISERQPSEYVLTNTVGTLNVINAVLAEKTVRRCVGISSDKACRPVNAYGMTKALLEKLFHEAGRRGGRSSVTVFTVARYGNVIGTRGSVVPFWREQRLLRVPLPITDPQMTRFLFSLEEAVDLVDFALTQDEGAVISKAMAAATLGDMANAMQTAGTIIVGRRLGEKIHEELLSEEEMARTQKVGEFFVYRPNLPPGPPVQAYTSQHAQRLTGEALHTLLQEYL